MSPLEEALRYHHYAEKFRSTRLTEHGYDYAVRINPKKATYRGQPLSTLGTRGRKKFENLIMLHMPRTRIKFIYD